MQIDPDLRIALGFMLLLRCAIGFAYSDVLAKIGIFAELRRENATTRWLERVVWTLLVLPVLPFLWDANGLAWIVDAMFPAVAEYTMIQQPEFLRWLQIVPAVVGLLLAIGTRRCAACPTETSPDVPLGVRLISGPFRIVRFPQWLADLVLFGSLLVATDNWIALSSFLVGCFVLRLLYLPRAEEAWKRLLGDDYSAYSSSTGVLLPRLPRVVTESAPQYSVPKQFGMSAIIALVTMFAVIFGGLNAFQKQVTEFDFTPVLHLYFGLLLMLVWIAQMKFGKWARVASLVVGAILLPVFVFASPHPTLPVGLFAAALVFLGGVVGYCMGALAAGFFLLSRLARTVFALVAKT